MRAWILVTVLAACAAPTQSEECRRYVACVEALDLRRGTSTDLVRFEPEGGCWGGEEAGAALCTEACGRGLTVIQGWTAGDVPEACR